MAGFARSGDSVSVNSTFEALSAEAINAITTAMPSLIDKLNDGTASAEDFEQAMLKIREAEDKAGKDAWKDYFGDTAAGLKQQSALWSDAMRSIIADVSAAEDKESAFYQSLIRLSKPSSRGCKSRSLHWSWAFRVFIRMTAAKMGSIR